MNTHPASELFPMMEGEEFANLVEDIRAKGLVEPLWITQDGLLLDGRNRLKACQSIGIEPKTRTYTGTDPVGFVLSLNMARRHLTAGQKAMLALKVLSIYEEEGLKAKEAAGGDKKSHKAKSLEADRPQAISKPKRNPQARDKAAKATQVSGRAVARAKRIKENAPDLAAKVESGELALDQAEKQVRKEVAEAKKAGAETKKPKISDWISIDVWNALGAEEKKSCLVVHKESSASFNYQDDNTNIEWARWSWNPVTGCEHGCRYCYARDITERFSDVFPFGFKPAISQARLSAPYTTKPKAIADNWSPVDVLGHKNVFTCSMADLFGKWVPNAWIEAVLQTVSDNPQWNFLFLSKFPQKMREFEFPDNAWVGTSVDKQGAVARAESAFTGIKAKVKWLSCEPMLERLTFKSLGMFDWVVIGGASKSTQSDAFNPPFEWVSHLVNQCEASNAKVYMKTNLFGDNTRIRQYPV